MTPAPLSPQAVQVVKWLTEGHAAQDIIAGIREKLPGADPDGAIAEATQYLAKQGDLDRAVVTGWAAEACRELYRRMVSVGDFANALRAVKQLTDLASPRREPPASRRPPANVSLSDEIEGVLNDSAR